MAPNVRPSLVSGNEAVLRIPRARQASRKAGHSPFAAVDGTRQTPCGPKRIERRSVMTFELRALDLERLRIRRRRSEPPCRTSA